MAVAKAVPNVPSVIVKGERARLPYALNPIIEEIRSLIRECDIDLESALAEFDAALADDGRIDLAEAPLIRRLLENVFVRNVEQMLVMSLLDESGPEPAQRAVEHIQAKRRIREQTRRGRK